MERFLGNSDAKTDAKGRVFVPAAFRKILQSSGNTRLVMRKDIFKDCLVLYPENVWNEALDSLRAGLNPWNEEQQDIFRQFVLDVEILEMDTNGRILISKRYMQMAGISSDIRFVGMSNTIEVWAKSKLEKPLMSPEDFKKGIEKWMSTQ
jgi:MraZ protein